MFDNLWEKAIPAEQKIREIEEGIESEFVEVITDGYKAATLGVDFAKSVQKEAQLILPHARTVLRFNKIGIRDALINAANNYGAKIRVISPIDDENQEEVKAILNRAPNIKILAGPYSTSGLIIQDDIRYMRVENKSSESTSDNIEEVVAASYIQTVETASYHSKIYLKRYGSRASYMRSSAQQMKS